MKMMDGVIGVLEDEDLVMKKRIWKKMKAFHFFIFIYFDK